MGKDHKGQPAGTNNQESKTGVPSKMETENRKQNDHLTDRYTQNDQEIPDGIREINPNRNTDKTDATNAGAYRN